MLLTYLNSSNGIIKAAMRMLFRFSYELVVLDFYSNSNSSWSLSFSFSKESFWFARLSSNILVNTSNFLFLFSIYSIIRIFYSFGDSFFAANFSFSKVFILRWTIFLYLPYFFNERLAFEHLWDLMSLLWDFKIFFIFT